MTHELDNDLGNFEGFNFKTQSAIWPNPTAEEVVNWDHDLKGEAEFWPEGSNDFVRLLADGNCSASELLEIDRIFTECRGIDFELVKAVFLKVDRGYRLEEITAELLDETCLSVYGLGYFSDLQKEAAWDLLETFFPEGFRMIESCSVPGITFDENEFLSSFSVSEISTSEHQGYLVVDIM